MASTIYRRQSMAHLYEKLRAQDDDDDMAWLAQYSPDDKFDEPYVPAAPSPPSLSTISFASPVSSYSSTSSASDPQFDADSSDDHFDFDSDSDVDPEPLSPDLSFTGFDPSLSLPLVFPSDDLTAASEPPDSPSYVSSAQVFTPQPRSTPSSIVSDYLPLPTILPAPFVTSRRTPRPTRRSYHSPIVLQDSAEDMHSDSDGNGSEDEYVPSPSLGPKKRCRSTRSNPGTAFASSQKRPTQGAPRKRPRYSPQPRNAQTTGVLSGSPVAKNNQWACPYCKWVQRNHRTPDLKRHIRTHTRSQRPAQWVCCGVPVKDAGSYNLPADAESYIWAGEEMVGGCCKEFSRRDALKRHLDNDHISCIGNFAAFASICEDEI